MQIIEKSIFLLFKLSFVAFFYEAASKSGFLSAFLPNFVEIVVGIGIAIPYQRLESSRSPPKITKRIESSGIESRIRPSTNADSLQLSKR
jgi:hypothetical protein